MNLQRDHVKAFALIQSLIIIKSSGGLYKLAATVCLGGSLAPGTRHSPVGIILPRRRGRDLLALDAGCGQNRKASSALTSDLASRRDLCSGLTREEGSLFL